MGRILFFFFFFWGGGGIVKRNFCFLEEVSCFFLIYFISISNMLGRLGR